MTIRLDHTIVPATDKVTSAAYGGVGCWLAVASGI
jgi:hypothetical protein